MVLLTQLVLHSWNLLAQTNSKKIPLAQLFLLLWTESIFFQFTSSNQANFADKTDDAWCNG